MVRRFALGALGAVTLALLCGCAPAPAAPKPDAQAAHSAGISPAAPETPAAAKGACDKPAAHPIPAQRFDETAQQLAHATGCFIETDLSRTAAVPVNAVTGAMSIRQALETALAGTPLEIVAQTPDRITVR
ncbi:STN domain-containing protein [Salinicola sp. JS01]|uniref:STN domain-containing protein n=1 Tax=Salinicola sp. JS01 TaxID=3050071 RepID=UPI00255B6081|nr:STN domain-containing protein [Salinicola sp. JS01]WIX31657.1 STN domain-containing protein [Salinicola sp. JS01]